MEEYTTRLKQNYSYYSFWRVSKVRNGFVCPILGNSLLYHHRPWMSMNVSPAFFGSIPYEYFLVVKSQILISFHLALSRKGILRNCHQKLLANYFLSLVSFEMLFCSYHLDPILDLHEHFFISSGPADFRSRRPPRRFIPVVELVPGIFFWIRSTNWWFGYDRKTIAWTILPNLNFDQPLCYFLLEYGRLPSGKST